MTPERRHAVVTLIAGALLGVAVFLIVAGPAIVNPANLGWTMRFDYQIYVLAWEHFRYEPWGSPLGAIAGVGHPVGTSIGNADAIPVVAFPLKLVSHWLPTPSQFLGAWLLLCFALQGLFAVLVMRQATRSIALQSLGAALFVQVPALFNRLGHPALCAHWLLLASLWLVIAGARAPRRWHFGAWIVLAVTVAATQPYLAAMVLALALSAVVNRAWGSTTGLSRWRSIAVESGALLLAMGVVFWQCGYFVVRSVEALQQGGVGYFSMNLLGPIMPMGFSTLLPEIGLGTPGQYEGHVYFGAGWLLLSCAAFILGIRYPGRVPRLGVAWLAILACTLIALSPVVTFGTTTLLDLQAWAPSMLGVFRSSGRFGWVPMYAAFSLVALTIVSTVPRKVSIALFAAALSLQTVDLAGAYTAIRQRQYQASWTDYQSPLESAMWDDIASGYRHLVMVPPDMCAAVWAPPAGPHLPFSLLAARHRATINSGYAGRYDFRAVSQYCRELEAEVRAGTLRGDSAYVLSPQIRAVVGRTATQPLMCASLDGFDVCALESADQAWQQRAIREGLATSRVVPMARSE